MTHDSLHGKITIMVHFPGHSMGNPMVYSKGYIYHDIVCPTECPVVSVGYAMGHAMGWCLNWYALGAPGGNTRGDVMWGARSFVSLGLPTRYSTFHGVTHGGTIALWAVLSLESWDDPRSSLPGMG